MAINCCCDENSCCQSWKRSVRFASTANLAASRVGNVLTANANGVLSVDGISPVVDERGLVKNQTAGADNGIYDVTDIGSATTPWVMTRSTDFDRSCDITSGLIVSVSEGTTNADTVWMLTTNETIYLNTTSLAFSQLTSSFTTLVLASATATSSVTNTTTETTLTTGIGAGTLTIAANTLAVGSQVKIWGAGLFDTGPAPPTGRLRVKIGSVVILDTGNFALLANLTDRVWRLDCTFTVRTAGATGTAIAENHFEYAGSAQGPLIAAEMANSTTVTIDTTVANVLDVTWQYGVGVSASDVIDCTNLAVFGTI